MMFERLFMSALAFRLKDGDLPMRCELFYANLLLPSRPPDVTLDLKKSAFKKQQKLFAAFEKKKLVAVKKVHGHECVARVDRDHPLYLEFVRAARDAGAGTSASAEPGDAGATDGKPDPQLSADLATLEGDAMDDAMAELGRIQDEIDAGDLWDLDRKVDIACAALRRYRARENVELNDEDDKSSVEIVAEIAAFAVRPGYRNEGRGDQLLEYLEREARRENIEKLFLLTTRTADWFTARGFTHAGAAEKSPLLPPGKKTLPGRNSQLYVRTLRRESENS